jgi:FkbM family methyltransferase
MKKLTLKQYLRYSSIYDRLAMISGSTYGVLLKNDFQFYNELLKEKKIYKIFDIGSNNGIRLKTFINFSNYIVAVEPDPDLVSIIKYRFSNLKYLYIEEFAVSSSNGKAEFEKKKYSGFNTLSKKWSNILDIENIETIDKFIVKTITLDDLIKKHGNPDYVKVDVEGFELEVLKNLNTKIPIISFEVNLPDFLDESIGVIHHISKFNQRTSFNFRLGIDKSLKLVSNVGADEIVDILGKMGKVSFDIFAFM